MKSRGFTLVELLVVTTILSLLAGLLLPAVQAARSAAREAECRHNLHEIGVDLHCREGRRGEIPDFLKGPHRFQCPDCALGDGGAVSFYFQVCAHDRRHALVESYQAPSERIVAVYDFYAVHRQRRLAVFLDGHVDFIKPEDVGYEDL